MIYRLGLFLIAVCAHLACAQQTYKPWGSTRQISLNDVTYECVTVFNTGQIRLWHKSRADSIYTTFRRLKDDNRNVVCAMNAGMFDPRFEPVGLFVEDGKQKHSINLNEGYGNFHLMPNGVFAIGAQGKAIVIESKAFDSIAPKVQYATQSGPMLVIDGAFHPALREGSKNKHIRNGVGVDDKGQVVFAISNQRCNFFDFARIFRDSLHCNNALYLDGAISKMFNEQSGRKEDGQFGVIVGVIE